LSIFDNSRTKIGRAWSKYNNLEKAINSFLASQPYSTKVVEAEDKLHLIARQEKELPDDIHHEVVEIVGHLRAALDKMLVAIVKNNGRGTSGVSYPFGSMVNDKPDQFPTDRMTGKHGIKKKLSTDQWALILKQNPCPQGNKRLWSVNELANIDKHQDQLVTTEPVIGEKMLIDTNAPGASYIKHLEIRPRSYQHLLSDPGKEVVMVSLDAKASYNLHVKHELMANIVFKEAGSLSHSVVLQVVFEQITETEKVIRQFDGLLSGPKRTHTFQ
jgi:hypothetical protein